MDSSGLGPVEKVSEHEFCQSNTATRPPDLQDRRVVIVDFSYARPILEAMASETKELLVLDHHITAERT